MQSEEGRDMTDKDSPNQPIPEPRTITLPRKDFQPSKSDMEREYDMPGLSLDEIRSTFFRPFNIRYEDSE